MCKQPKIINKKANYWKEPVVNVDALEVRLAEIVVLRSGLEIKVIKQVLLCREKGMQNKMAEHTTQHHTTHMHTRTIHHKHTHTHTHTHTPWSCLRCEQKQRLAWWSQHNPNQLEHATAEAPEKKLSQTGLAGNIQETVRDHSSLPWSHKHPQHQGVWSKTSACVGCRCTAKKQQHQNEILKREKKERHKFCAKY